MTVRIEGIPVHCGPTRQALEIVAGNPQAYGIPPQDLRRRGADVDFTQDQVIQILNPASPERGEVNFRDMGERTRQGTAPLTEEQFAALAQEFAHRFPNREERRSIFILPDLLSRDRASCFTMGERDIWMRRSLIMASDPDAFWCPRTPLYMGMLRTCESDGHEEIPAWCEDREAFDREVARRIGDCRNELWRRFQHR